ncbi:cobalamin-independent methionine synthase II family protein [Flindersiella endophytica]
MRETRVMHRSTERILTTHTGSLPRPSTLAEALERRDRGEPADPGLPDRIADAVRTVVRRQADAGLDVVNDGEAGKIGYSTYVKERLTGFGGQSAPRSGRTDFDRPACVAALDYPDLGPVRTDVANLQAGLAGSETTDAFLTAASPGVIALFLDNQYYDTHEDYIWALADTMKAEYDEIHRSGLLLQLDCPDLTSWQAGEDLSELRKRAELHLAALDHATRDIPGDALRLHLCWGNYEGPHTDDVPLRDLIDLVLAARPDAISFEGANPRHAHEWALFEDVELPDGKVLIPGVLDSTTNYVEHPDLVTQRIERYASLVGRENVIAGSDCGYATFATTPTVRPEVAWEKLAALAEGARAASERLW